MASPRDEHETERAAPDEESLRARIQEFIPEILKRGFLAGLGAVFTTEEGIRRLAQESRLPKDVANYFIAQAQATKKELFRIVAGELREWLEKLDLQQLLLRLLTSLTFEITTQVRLVPTDTNLVKPEIRPRVKVRRRKDAPAEEQDTTEVTVSVTSHGEAHVEPDEGEEPAPPPGSPAPAAAKR